MVDEEDAYDYERGATLSYAIIRRWVARHPEDPPRFAFPPEDVAVLGDVRDCVGWMARNESAKGLLREMIDHVLFFTGKAPTVMMVRVILTSTGLRHLIEWVPLADLKTGPFQLVRRDQQRGRA